MNIKKMLLSLFAIITSILIYESIISSGESISRKQNNFNLEAISTCVMHVTKTHGMTSEQLNKSFDICSKSTRSLGITGDVFVMRKEDKKLFWDSSIDCRPESGEKLYMTRDGVCGLFSDVDSCVEAVDIMIDNPPEGSITWKFDDDIEYIDYRYIQDRNAITGITQPLFIDGSEYIVAQGTQKDEIQGFFKLTYILLIVGNIILILIINY